MSEGRGTPTSTRPRDGREWRIGTRADVAWIRESTPIGRTITSAIPPVFEAYATIVVPDEDEGRAEDVAVVLGLLTEQSPGLPWWLGHLDTGFDDPAFPGAPRVSLYSHWPYVPRQAGPAEAARWRSGRPVVAAVAAVGRYLALPGRAGRARPPVRRAPAPAGAARGPRRGRHPAGSRRVPSGQAATGSAGSSAATAGERRADSRSPTAAPSASTMTTAP
ncbi:hypothetical protein SAMN05660359_01576 [Geodermatophilus obscurus]|uniref:Uncharacterized protein n=1 Tax=Geodermatophilus obscurus TaxID=1861 RepID=A0A1I5EMB7_9ACTN|nr:hypothetical protein SAMN05660359_01576 [Geodermatophilus obscurus]